MNFFEYGGAIFSHHFGFLEVAGRRQQPAQFQIGDYVLVLCIVPRNKLRARWLGPSRVVDTVNPYVYVVEDLLTSKQTIRRGGL